MRLGPVKTETSGPRTAQTLLREAMVRRRKAIIPAALAAAFSALSLKYLPLPYAWIALAWAAACIVGFSASTHAVARTLLVNLAVVWLALGAPEAYARFALNGGEGIAPTYTEGYRLRDRILGMVPPKAIVARSKRVIQGSPIFDATYGIRTLAWPTASTLSSKSRSFCRSLRWTAEIHFNRQSVPRSCVTSPRRAGGGAAAPTRPSENRCLRSLPRMSSPCCNRHSTGTGTPGTTRTLCRSLITPF